RAVPRLWPRASIVVAGRALARCVIERLKYRLAVTVQSGQQGDLLFRDAELGVTPFQESDPAFVSRQALFQRGGTVLQGADDLFEFGQGLFERRAFAHGVSSAG